MPRFMAAHTVPITEEQWMEQAKKSSEQMSKLPPGVVWNSTYCGFADGKFFCDWEAPNKETVEQVLKAMEMPFDAVYPVKLFSVSTMDFVDWS